MTRSKNLLMKSLIAALPVCLCLAHRAEAYVDLAPTMSKIVSDSPKIAVVEVVGFDRATRVVSVKEVRALKGDLSPEVVQHQVAPAAGGAVPGRILQWAASPGARGVLFASRRTALVCIGEGWYQVNAAASGPWTLGAERPDLPLAYYGAVSRLADGVEALLAGKGAVITVVAFGADNEGASFDLALNRQNLPGIVRVQRIRATSSMPGNVAAASANPAYFIGPGAVDERDVPALVERLSAADGAVRAEAAEDLRTLGRKAKAAAGPLAKLLADAAPRARFAAAAALLKIDAKDAKAVDVLSRGLADADGGVRLTAARAAGYAGKGGAPLAGKLAGLLKDSDAAVRATALESISMLGSAAGDAAAAVTPLLDDADLKIDAADALGRIGAAARPALGKLTQMLKADQPSVRWAAVRAMSQIGGQDAHPAVDFMIKAFPTATEVEGYNMMIYLSLLGPVAVDAVPTIQSTRIKNPVLPSSTLWAIAPDKSFPWQGGGGFGRGRGGRGGGDFGGPGGGDQNGPGGFGGPGGGGPGRGGPGMGGGPGDGGPGMGGPGGGGMANIGTMIYQAYVRELGDRLRPAAKVLAQKIMDGSAGEVPLWGYEILSCGPDVALEVLTPNLAAGDLQMRERATVAIGYMGEAAQPAKAAVEAALAKAASPRETLLLQWCLRQLEAD